MKERNTKKGRQYDKETKLFCFLSKSVIKSASGDMNVFSVFVDTVICNKEHDLNTVAPWSPEEGDTRVFLHVPDMVHSGHSIVKVHIVDSDIRVIGLAMFQMI